MAETMPQIHYIAQAKVAVETSRHLLTLPWPCAPRCKGPRGAGFLHPWFGFVTSLKVAKQYFTCAWSIPI